MQFKITLRTLGPQTVLPLNYQYELSAWIYRVIQRADEAYAAFLHQHGHRTPERKQFKLFSFSQLEVPKRRIDGDRLHIGCPEVSFRVGFYVDRTAEEFVRGLFQSQRFRLGDKESQVDFEVHTVEMLPIDLPAGTGLVRLRALSPLVVARKRPDGQPDEYLHPDDPDFGRLLLLNLLEKYRAATGQEPPVWWDVERFVYRRREKEPKSRLVTLKTGTEAQTRVKGWLFDFEMDAPRELVELGLMAGMGRMNGEGFGFVGVGKLRGREDGSGSKRVGL
jgi:CRISPR-associated endoribonuclease Cas6